MAFENDPTELDNFKCKLNFVDYAESVGYEVDAGESSRNSIILRGPGDDKLIVGVAESGHWIYFSVRDPKDNGSIIDFIKNRQHSTLGQIRRELRNFMGVERPANPTRRAIRKPIPTAKDRHEVVRGWHRLKPYTSDYLEKVRCLSPETIRVFSKMIRQDKYGNACFGHRDEEGLTGWEKKNSKFTGFSTGGDKMIFAVLVGNERKQAVIAESAIDLMSYYQLRPADNTLYLSFGGALSPEQWELLERIFPKVPTLIVATDNDSPGEKFFARMSEMHPNALRHRPTKKDWNEDLKALVKGDQPENENKQPP